MSAGGAVTIVLGQLRERNDGAADQLIPLIYKKLRRMAAAHMRPDRSDHTLQATAVVHESYMPPGDKQGPLENRARFFAISAHTMRKVLLDQARRHRAEKCGGSATAWLQREMTGVPG